jgi:hypothetical protein
MALVRTDVSEEHVTSIFRMVRIVELGTTLAITSNLLQLLVIVNVVPSPLIPIILMVVAIRSSYTSVLTRNTWRNIPEVGIFAAYYCFFLLKFRNCTKDTLLK